MGSNSYLSFAANSRKSNQATQNRRCIIEFLIFDMTILYSTTPDYVVISGAMKPSTSERNNQPVTDNVVRTAHEDGIPMASIEIHGDKWCVFGDDRVSGFV